MTGDTAKRSLLTTHLNIIHMKLYDADKNLFRCHVHLAERIMQ